MDSRFEFTETDDAGCILKVRCLKLSEEFSNFINIDYYVLSEQRREKDHTVFVSGRRAAREMLKGSWRSF